ncbi:MAG: TAXI family TRAP transporter solute-binding subunit [Oscillospiraceae bacterium]|nr:TAXI family TRAP transporter solute-binding subunit [Oscillospiraceae bacterium]
MKKTKIIALLLAAILPLCSCSGKNETVGGSYMFATGKAGGTYYSLGTVLASVWDKYSQSTTNVTTTSGSVNNIEMLLKENADFGFVQSDILHYALEGQEMYEEDKQRGVSVVANLYPEYAQFVVNASTDIQTIPDLAGMTVAVGKYGTATEAAARKILEAYGVTYDMITVKYQTFSEAMSSLSSGSIDAAFAVSSLPSANILEYSQTREIRLLPVSLTQSASFKRSCPFFSDGMIPAETYGTANSSSTVCIDVLLICRTNLQQANVYSIVKALFDNTDEIASAHAKGADINAVTASETKIGTMHPGASQYYNSAGEEPAEDDFEPEVVPEPETSSEPEISSEPETSSEPEETGNE